jgi:hypothetical protein
MVVQHSSHGRFPWLGIDGLRRSSFALTLAASALALSACGGGGRGGDDGVVVHPQPEPTTPGPVLAALPKCADLPASSFFAGNAQVVNGTLKTSIVPATAATATVPATPAFCRVEFTFASGLQGPQDGYDQGQRQLIQVRTFLPLSAADGGEGGFHGNWNGKQMVGASGGNSGDPESWSSFAEGTNMNDFKYAIRLGYIASNTDTGQSNPPYVLITSGPLARTIAQGTVTDWASRATHYGKVAAAAVANVYFGKTPTRVYYNGCSGGGNQGLGQLQNFGAEYDGALIGAPANYRNERFLGFDSWPRLVWKKVVQQGGTIPTSQQLAAVNASAVAACDVQGNDLVADGIIADPRACTFSAKANVCGAPGAPASPNCLTEPQATGIDRIWDGPRNRFGDRTYFGWPRGSALPLTTALGGGAAGAGPTLTIQWNHLDPTLDFSILYSDPESVSLAGSPATAMSYDDEAALGSNTIGQFMANRDVPQDAFRAKGGKIIHVHGMQDTLINWQQSLDYYRRTATMYGNGTADYASLQSWYRFFPQPGAGHCSGGPVAVDPFLALVDWVENGKAPDSLPARTAATPTTTRKLCPYPQTAVYKGTGNKDDAANYSCSGSLDTRQTLCDSVRTKFKLENKRNLDFASLGIDPSVCPGLAP